MELEAKLMRPEVDHASGESRGGRYCSRHCSTGPRWTGDISPPSFRSSVGRVETQNLRFYADAG